MTALLRPANPSRDGPLRRGPRQACALLRPELPSDGGGGVPSAAVTRPAPVTFWRPCASPEPPCVVAAPEVLRGVTWKHLAVLSGWFITHGAESGDKTLIAQAQPPQRDLGAESEAAQTCSCLDLGHRFLVSQQMTRGFLMSLFLR